MSRPLLVAVPLLALANSGCLIGAVIGNTVFEQTVEQSRSAAAFENLRVTDGLFVSVQQGPPSLTVKAKESDLDFVEAEVVDGTLVVRLREERRSSPDQSVATITVATTSLKSIEADDWSAVELQPRTGDSDLAQVRLDHAELYTYGIEGLGSLRAEVRNTGRFVVPAQIPNLELVAAADAYVELLGGVGSLQVSAGQRSELLVQVADAVRGTVSGGSRLRVRGAPTVREVAVSDGGQVLFE